MYDDEDERRRRSNVRAGLLLLALALLILPAIYLVQMLREQTDLAPTDVQSEDVTQAPDVEVADEPAPEIETPPQPPQQDQFRLSPDGSMIAFLYGERFRRDVWVAPRDNTSAARPLDLAQSQGVTAFEWAANGTHILFRRPFDILAQIYSADVAFGHVTTLIPFEDQLVGTYETSPWHPDEIMIHLGPAPGIAMNLFRINIVTGEAWVVETANNVVEYYVDRDFLVRAARRNRDGGFSLLSRLESGWEEILSVDRALGQRSGSLFLGAGHDFIYLLDDRGGAHVSLSSIDLATGERFVVAAPGEGNVTHVMREPASGEIFAYAVDVGEQEWRAIDPAYRDDIAQLNRRFGNGYGIVSQSLDNRLWIIEHDQDNWLFDRDADSISSLP